MCSFNDLYYIFFQIYFVMAPYNLIFLSKVTFYLSSISFQSSINSHVIFFYFFYLNYNKILFQVIFHICKYLMKHIGEGNGIPLQYSCLENPWTKEPGRLQSMGSLRVGHDWATSLSLFSFMHWRRKWQPTPVFLPGESQGWRSMVGCRLWGRTESDMTEVT